MIILVDNYDSFTYILNQYLQIAGAKTKVIKNDELSVQNVVDLNPKGLVFSPGPGTPEQSGISFELFAQTYETLPILGVCLGHQIIASYFGALVENAASVRHGKPSIVTHNGSKLFAGVESNFTVGRYHSLSIVKNTMPDSLIATAITNDDEKEIMALEHTTLPVFGVQFHPESIMTQCGQKIISNFVELCNR